jgi:lipoate-protein ligase A
MDAWRLIDDKPRNPFFNMALDEAISEAVRKKLSPPTLRTYQWETPSVSIGYFQNISDINIDYCRKMGYPVVRRQTGGMAILHNFELTYSFSAHSEIEQFKGGFLKNYMALNNALVLALKLINLDAQIILSKNRRQRGRKNLFTPRSPYCFKISSYGEITVNGKKVIGSAQKRYKDGSLQQGSIMIDLNEEEVRKVLRVLKEGEPRTVQVRGEGEFGKIGTIKKYAPTVSVEDLKKSLKEAFEKTFMIKFIYDNPTEFELNRAKQLEAEKYSTNEWNFRL